jgi:hypothetical protein
MVGGDLVIVNQMIRVRSSFGGTHGVRAELVHDGLEGLLILLEEQGQLLVLVKERLVLDDSLGVNSF